jgi:hypothetical protein
MLQEYFKVLERNMNRIYCVIPLLYSWAKLPPIPAKAAKTATFLWNRWQLCPGIGGNLQMELVASLEWNLQVTVKTR